MAYGGMGGFWWMLAEPSNRTRQAERGQILRIMGWVRWKVVWAERLEISGFKGFQGVGLAWLEVVERAPVCKSLKINIFLNFCPRYPRQNKKKLKKNKKKLKINLVVRFWGVSSHCQQRQKP
jgi:hypothetical protein